MVTPGFPERHQYYAVADASLHTGITKKERIKRQMAKTMIDNRIYNDVWFFSLPQKAKWLFMFLLTNEGCNLIGCYELPIPIISSYTAMTEKELKEVFPKLREKINYIDGWVIIKNYSKYNPMRNPSIEISKKKQEDLLPEKIKQYYDQTISIPEIVSITHPPHTPSTLSQLSKNKYSQIESLTEQDFKEIAEHYNVTIAFVVSKYEDMLNWHEMKPHKNHYSNYRRALMHWVKRDRLKIIERRLESVRPTIDATGLSSNK